MSRHTSRETSCEAASSSGSPASSMTSASPASQASPPTLGLPPRPHAMQHQSMGEQYTSPHGYAQHAGEIKHEAKEPASDATIPEDHDEHHQHDEHLHMQQHNVQQHNVQQHNVQYNVQHNMQHNMQQQQQQLHNMQQQHNQEQHNQEHEVAYGVQQEEDEEEEEEDEGVPMHHPRPVPLDTKLDIIAPSVSVPPEDAAPAPVAVQPSPRRSRHRRTTSASVELSGERVLPIEFSMVRKNAHSARVYSRLLRAAYESPLRPFPLSAVLAEFCDLQALHDAGELRGAPVVYGTVAIYIAKPLGGVYQSDVQYMLNGTDAAVPHHYYAKTVITSRKTDLLRCELPCAFQRIPGRGLEEDKEIVNVPFLPDFWSDFLHRLDTSSAGYARAALGALKMCQAIYRITEDKEELCFVSVYKFGAANDEFSARTRFRRIHSDSSAMTGAAAMSGPLAMPLAMPSMAPSMPLMPLREVPEEEINQMPEAPTKSWLHTKQPAHATRSVKRVLDGAEPFAKRRCSEPEVAQHADNHATEHAAEHVGEHAAEHHEDATVDDVDASAASAALAVPHAMTLEDKEHSRHRRTDSSNLLAQLMGTPTPRPRSSADGPYLSSPRMMQTPRAQALSNLLGLGTPGDTMSLFGHGFNFESPLPAGSPSKGAATTTVDGIDFSASPFGAALNNDVRSSPRGSRFEIQRSMTAFEPQAWDEMQEWIFP